MSTNTPNQPTGWVTDAAKRAWKRLDMGAGLDLGPRHLRNGHDPNITAADEDHDTLDPETPDAEAPDQETPDSEADTPDPTPDNDSGDWTLFSNGSDQPEPLWVQQIRDSIEDLSAIYQDRAAQGADTLAAVAEVATSTLELIRNAHNQDSATLDEIKTTIAEQWDTEPDWFGSIRTQIDTLPGNSTDTMPGWAVDLRAELAALESRLGTELNRARNAAEAALIEIEGHRTAAPGWADQMATGIGQSRLQAEQAIAQIAEITTTGLQAIQDYVQGLPTDRTDEILARLDHKPEWADRLTGMLSDINAHLPKLGHKPEWAYGMSEMLSETHAHVLGLVASSDDAPAWGTQLTSRLDNVSNQVDEALRRHGDVATTTLDTIRDVMVAAVDDIRSTIAATDPATEPAWATALLERLDTEPAWMETQRDDLTKMSDRIGKLTSTSADQVIATLNDFARHLTPLAEFDDRLDRIEKLVAQLDGRTETAATTGAETHRTLNQVSEAITASSQKAELILSGVDEIQESVAAVNTDTLVGAVDAALAPRFENLTGSIDGMAAHFDRYDTRFDTLNTMLTGVVTVVERASEHQAAFHNTQTEEAAAVRDTVEEAAAAVTAMAAQLRQVHDEWAAASQSFAKVDATAETITGTVDHLAQFVDTTLTGLLDVLERNETALAQVVESTTGPDDLRTHLAEMRSAIGGLARDVQHAAATGDGHGGGGADIGTITVLSDRVEGVAAQVADIRNLLTDPSASGPAGTDEATAAIREVRSVRALLETLQDQLATLPATGDGAALTTETAGLVANVHDTMAALSEIRLLTAGQAERFENLEKSIDAVREIVETFHDEMGPKVEELAAKAQRAMAASRPRRERPLRAS